MSAKPDCERRVHAAVPWLSLKKPSLIPDRDPLAIASAYSFDKATQGDADLNLSKHCRPVETINVLADRSTVTGQVRGILDTC